MSKVPISSVTKALAIAIRALQEIEYINKAAEAVIAKNALDEILAKLGLKDE